MTRLPRILTDVPQLPHVHLEIAKAIRALAAQAQEERWQQQQSLSVISSDDDLSKQLIREVLRDLALLRRSIANSPTTKAAVDDPKHPGWPAGAPGGKGGQFRPKDSNASADQSDAVVDSSGKNAPQLGPPPHIPIKEPATAKALNIFLKTAAYWIAEAALVDEPAGAAFLIALQAAKWLSEFRPWIDAYQDPPKTLKKLQQDLSALDGYNIHHIVEQTPARKDGYPDSAIDAPDNLVPLPTLTHWLISAWFSRQNDNFGGLSPEGLSEGQELG